MARPDQKDLADRQYRAWGVVVQTQNVRAGHVANGLVQLLRLASKPPPWPTTAEPGKEVATYLEEVKRRLGERFAPWRLSDAARALCVVESKRGPLLLESKREKGEPGFLEVGRDHVRTVLTVAGGGPLLKDMHRLVHDALNADERVMESGGADPTTPGLSFAGFTDTHTLKGMHAATFLGLMCQTHEGTVALSKLYRLLRRTDDPHSQLVAALHIATNLSAAPEELAPAAFQGAYPLPPGSDWTALAGLVGRMALNLMAWSERGTSKADTLMAMVDLAALVLVLRLLRWSGGAGGTSPTEGRLLLVVAPAQNRGSLLQVTSRAQRSLQATANALDYAAKEAKLILVPQHGDTKAPNRYPPSVHALNLGAAGGWLYPLHAQGGARRYFRPGSRQLATLVHALVAPGEEVTWPEFAHRAEQLGLALGGPGEHRTEHLLRIGGTTSSLREAGRVNREHLVALGLARMESDNVIIIDGGTR